METGVLIGEGVVLDARPASFVTRTLGALLDAITLITAEYILIMALSQVISADTIGWISILTFVVSLLLVPAFVETFTRGRSVGKLAVGIRIVRDDGGPIRFRHAFVRALTGLIELWATLGSVAVIASLCNDKGKRLGDLMAGTYAVRVRGGAPTFAPLFMPQFLAGWAHQADMRRLPDGLALSARQFLTRANSLNAASRTRLGGQLAAQMERYVAPGPPPGTHPEAFLAAVLAERRDRDLGAAARSYAEVAAYEAEVAKLPYTVPDPRA